MKIINGYRSVLCALIALLAVFAASCDDDSVSSQAERSSYDQIMASERMKWFVSLYNAYECKPSTVEAIKNVVADDMKFVVFGVPANCSCTPDYFYFPRILKTLRLAGIPDSKTDILIMYDISYKHPYQSVYRENGLPDFFVMRGGEVKGCRLIDSISAIKAKDPNAVINVEDIILNIIKGS